MRSSVSIHSVSPLKSVSPFARPSFVKYRISNVDESCPYKSGDKKRPTAKSTLLFIFVFGTVGRLMRPVWSHCKTIRTELSISLFVLCVRGIVKKPLLLEIFQNNPYQYFMTALKYG